MYIAELERTLKSCDYVCDICSHSDVYGFLLFIPTLMTLGCWFLGILAIPVGD